MSTVYFKNTYVQSRAAVVGPLESQGPLGEYFDKTFDNDYCNEPSFEKAEQSLVLNACDLALRKAKLCLDDIDIAVGGDLMNQISSSNYVARHLDTPFIGMYGACSNSSLTIAQAAIWVENKYCDYALAFTSSHVAGAEKQFRFPNEYGIQKKPTTTLTVTGAGAIVLGNKISNIRLCAFTPGKVVDWDFKDANDMGCAMAPACYDTLIRHLRNTKTRISDYDAIYSGDLSKLGSAFLIDLLARDGFKQLDKIQDCGLMIYDNLKQNVFCGGSGCGCSMCVSMAKLLDDIATKKMKRILVIATGALLSPIMVQQKESIPCIAHAIEYSGGEI